MILTIDLETKDPGLTQRGSGAFRKEGYILGVAIKKDENESQYIPIGHRDENKTIAYLLSVLSDPEISLVIGANLIYDLAWLKGQLGFEFPRDVKFFDIQVNEALLDENRLDYRLDALAHKYLGDNKDTEELRMYAEANNLPKKYMQYLDLFPTELVGKYAKKDVDLTYAIYKAQKKGDTLDFEMDIMRLLLKVKERGVFFDTERSKESLLFMKKKSDEVFKPLLDLVGEVDIWSPKVLGKICDKYGWIYPKTDKGNPSLDQEFLSKDPNHPFFPLVLEARKWDRAGSSAMTKLLDYVEPDGVLRPTYRQTKGGHEKDKGGTISGRWSCEEPNLQQIPSRNPNITPLFRKCFIAPEGYQFLKADYASQEIRVALGYAVKFNIPEAEGIAKYYEKDSLFDIYSLVAKEHYRRNPTKSERNKFKQVVLARMYGSGAETIAKNAEITVEEAQEIISFLRNDFPVFERASAYVQQIVISRARAGNGYLTTIGGRVRHFNLWGPAYGWKGTVRPTTLQEAKKIYGKVNLWGAYKALNALVQGTSSDFMKKSCLDIYKETGLVFALSVHDELCYYVQSKEQESIIKEKMENAYSWPIKMVAEVTLGETWHK